MNIKAQEPFEIRRRPTKQEYLEKFGGKLMNQNVIYGRYKEGPFIGKINNERKYEVDFSDAKIKMGTFHFLDGGRVRIF